jgi:hypothetical protein
MAYRGRLIFPFYARIGRLDLAGTAADPDGAGPEPSGFDEDFRAPVRMPLAGTQTGTSARKELPPLDLRCQVEDAAWEALQMMASGGSPRTEMTIVFHFQELERLKLVDQATGDALAPRKGDKLLSIHDKRKTLVQAIPEPGLFCREAAPRSFGLGAGARNLLVCVFEAREQSVRRSGGG